MIIVKCDLKGCDKNILGKMTFIFNVYEKTFLEDGVENESEFIDGGRFCSKEHLMEFVKAWEGNKC